MKIITRVYKGKEYKCSEDGQWIRMADLTKNYSGGKAIYSVAKALSLNTDVEVIRLGEVEPGVLQQCVNLVNVKNHWEDVKKYSTVKNSIYTVKGMIEYFEEWYTDSIEQDELFGFKMELTRISKKIEELEKQRKASKGLQEELEKAQNLIKELKEINLNLANERDRLKRENAVLQEFKNNVLKSIKSIEN